MSDLAFLPERPDTAGLPLAEAARIMREAPGALWIYVIRCGGYGGDLKIGRTRSVSRRLDELQRASGQELQVIGAWRDVPEREKDLHEKYAGLRIRGEWFMHALPLYRLARDFNEWAGACP